MSFGAQSKANRTFSYRKERSEIAYNASKTQGGIHLYPLGQKNTLETILERLRGKICSIPTLLVGKSSAVTDLKGPIKYGDKRFRP